MVSSIISPRLSVGGSSRCSSETVVGLGRLSRNLHPLLGGRHAGISSIPLRIGSSVGSTLTHISVRGNARVGTRSGSLGRMAVGDSDIHTSVNLGQASVCDGGVCGRLSNLRLSSSAFGVKRYCMGNSSLLDLGN